MNAKLALVPTSARPMALDEVRSMAEVLARSGFFSDARDVAQAVVKVLAGAEIGFGPVASMTGVYIVKGKVSLSANLMAAAIKRSGRYNYRVRKHSTEECEVEFFEGGESIGVSGFTMKEAAAAGLTSNDTWKKFPRNMLFARAMSNGAKWFCPDVFGGPPYTPDELGAPVNEDGEIIDLPAPRVVDISSGVEVVEAPALTNGKWAAIWTPWTALTTEARALGVPDAALTDITPTMGQEAIKARVIEVKALVEKARQLAAPAPAVSGPAATTAQVKAIYAVGGSEAGLKATGVDEISQGRYGALPAELTKRQASELLDHLRSLSRPMTDEELPF